MGSRQDIRRAAVIGGGTAGFMAAAHLSTRFPELDLLHVYDSTLPALGVGEGTLPTFPGWLHRTTGLDFEDLQERCGATLKLGVRFEGWGDRNGVFRHDFSAGAYAYHLSADRLPSVLEPAIRARHLDRRVRSLESDGRRVRIGLAGGETLDADFVFDARGFPRRLDATTTVALDAVATNAAWLRRGPTATWQGGTRAVARPHGWIFGIPLTTHTSYGYVFDDDAASVEEVSLDLGRFCHEEGVSPDAEDRLIRFPSFRRRSFFDGALFRIGNAASFLEPLEATALGLLLLQLQLASSWLGGELARGAERWEPRLLQAIDRHLGETVEALALFVGWHYSRGSRWETPFWRRARLRFDNAYEEVRDRALGRAFRDLLHAAAALPQPHVRRLRDVETYGTLLAPRLEGTGDLGGFNALSFAQLGEGLGIFDQRPVARGRPPIHASTTRGDLP